MCRVALGILCGVIFGREGVGAVTRKGSNVLWH